MKFYSSLRQNNSGQIMAEACIGLALMVFAWIIITYSLFMANNQIRTEMAARYAAWYAGNNNGTPPTAAKIDQYFFFQSGLSAVNPQSPALIGDAFTGQMPANSSKSFGGGDSLPFKEQISFGVTDPNNSANPFPFNLLTTHVPFMTNSMMAVYSVNSTCQWDDDSDTWTDASQALSGVWNTLKNDLGSFFSM